MRVEQRRFAVAVEADETDALAGIDDEVEIMDDPHRAIARRQALDIAGLLVSGVCSMSGRSSCERALRSTFSK